ncbi:MAG: coniferyl aldehyde dehydrogenase [Epibacterium sp.]|nr:coniferyl aldehyde dehydrogenase [Epibacterium sp.]NQX72673.1 coniferyl aldehyde dehydrogenase [Epibacterium sp.]
MEQKRVDTSNATDADLWWVSEIHERQTAAYAAHPMASAAERISRLKTLKRLLTENKDRLMEAMVEDFSARATNEMLFAEFLMTCNLIDYYCKHVKKWMKPEKRHLSMLLQPGKAKVFFQPLGVVGIMAPFNYPVNLSCGPLATALVAGNHALIKMPEGTPKTSALFEELVGEYFDPAMVSVVNGGPNVSSFFSGMPFDHLIFTGATAIGKHVMRAAADNLTPVTLELGGKSPVIIAEDFPIAEAADRLCFSKSFNSGQTCVAPDYVFVPRQKLNDFVAAYRKSFNAFFPKVGHNPEYSGVINEHHASRLRHLVVDAADKGARVEPMSDEVPKDGTRRMVQTLVVNPDDTMKIAHEEIFGPILMVKAYETIDEAINYVNDRDRPLALYVFSFDKTTQNRFLAETHSGGVVFNESGIHLAVDDLPFGGVGASGMGHYHGKEGFLTLSKAKSVLYKPRYNSTRLLYPPYKPFIQRMYNWLLR